MSEIQKLTKKLIKFRDERDWKQFHDSKNLASAISIEAAELNELFLWKKTDDSEKVDKEKLSEEIADIIAYSLLLAEKHSLDVYDIVNKKIDLNAKKYPVEKSKGSSAKYDQL